MEQLIRWFRETQFLVEQGIDSISLNPDAVMKTTVRILETEQALAPSRRSA